MSKTPFEIRLELLKLAQDAIWNNFNSKNYQYECQFRDPDKIRPMGPKNETGDYTYLDAPRHPTIEDVIKEAEKLNSFVSDRKSFTVEVSDMSPDDAVKLASDFQNKHRRGRRHHS